MRDFFFPLTSKPLGTPSSSAWARHKDTISNFCLDWCISARLSLILQSSYCDRKKPLIRLGVRELLCACCILKVPFYLVLKLIDLIIVPNRSALLVKGTWSTLTSGPTIPFFAHLTPCGEKMKTAHPLSNLTISLRLTATELREMVTVFISTNTACKSSLPPTVSLQEDFHQVLSIGVQMSTHSSLFYGDTDISQEHSSNWGRWYRTCNCCCPWCILKFYQVRPPCIRLEEAFDIHQDKFMMIWMLRNRSRETSIGL